MSDAKHVGPFTNSNPIECIDCYQCFSILRYCNSHSLLLLSEQRLRDLFFPLLLLSYIHFRLRLNAIRHQFIDCDELNLTHSITYEYTLNGLSCDYCIHLNNICELLLQPGLGYLAGFL